MNRRLGICLVVILILSLGELWAQQKTQCERDAVYANKNMVDYELKVRTEVAGRATGPWVGENAIPGACIAVFANSPDHPLVTLVTADSEGKFNLSLTKGTYRLVAWDPQKAFRVANAVVKVLGKPKKSKPTEIVVRFAVSGIDSGSWIELKR